MGLTNKPIHLYIISHGGKWGIFKSAGKRSIRNFKHRELAFHYAATNYSGVRISVHNKDGGVDFVYN